MSHDGNRFDTSTTGVMGTLTEMVGIVLAHMINKKYISGLHSNFRTVHFVFAYRASPLLSVMPDDMIKTSIGSLQAIGMFCLILVALCMYACVRLFLVTYNL